MTPCAHSLRHGLLGVLSLLVLLWHPISAADEQPPYLVVLGVVQDAGYPHIGCYAPHCMPGWQDQALQRGATTLGLVDSAAGRKFLFEASPDMPRQLYHLNQLAPDVDHALAGVFLTHAHIGHYTGLMYFGHEAQGAKNVPVYAMPRMSAFLRDNGPWSQLVSMQNIALQALQIGRPEIFGTLSVEPILVPHRDEYSETVGFRIAGPSKRALFIPDINKWDIWQQDLVEVIKGVDYALLDATFYSDTELPGRDMSKVPHPLVTDTMARLDALPANERAKVWFIHMNHTNPLLDDNSREANKVRRRGYNIATEGDQLLL